MRRDRILVVGAMSLMGCQLLFPTKELDPTASSDGGGASSDAGDASRDGSSDPEAGGGGAPFDVPGGEFQRSQTAPATVTGFRLDEHEVTVGRFRRFVDAYPGSRPRPGAGKHPRIPTDPGWQFDNALADTAALFRENLTKCNGDTRTTWTDAASGNESKPMSCVRWAEAFAFCIFEGGRLPTEAEWNFAAAGGAEQRLFPWGPTAPDATRGVFGADAPAPVGTKPAGKGRYGQLDLAGNVAEWVMDWKADYKTPCVDCATLDPPLSERIHRGGSYGDPPETLQTSARGSMDHLGRSSRVGFRCAR